MGFHGILIYVLRAFFFASVSTVIYVLIMKRRGVRLSAWQIVWMFYIMALLDITVVRDGPDWTNFFTDLRPAPRWMPMMTTLGEFRGGVWRFIYHVVGNLLWFIPLGVMLRRQPVWKTLLAGILFSAMIETLQWVFMTGLTDVDDVILNALGALTGRLIAGHFPARPQASREGEEAPPVEGNA
jgi:glycopeptide antibiotics resistance protein